MKHMSCCRCGTEDAAGAGDVPAAAIVLGRYGVADAACRFHAEHIGVQELAPGKFAVRGEGKKRGCNRRPGMDHRRQMRAAEIERIRRGAEDYRAAEDDRTLAECFFYQSDIATCVWRSSARVGSSGIRRLRSVLAAASTRSFPLLTCWMSEGAASNMSCTRWLTRSVTAGPLPLYGTCTIGAPMTLLKSSAAMCGAPPLPEEAKFTGCALAYATSSFTSRTGSSAFTAMMSGRSASPDTGAKSFTG